jgi:hypothetical protein
MKSAPARSLAEEGTGFERRLLESARGDGIPAAARDRLARALNVPLTATPIARAAHPSGSGKAGSGMRWRAVSSSAVRWGLFGLVGAAAAAMGAQRWLGGAPAASAAPAAVEVSAPVAATPVLLPPAVSPLHEAVLPASELTPPVPSTKAATAGQASARSSSSRRVPRRASPPAIASGSGDERGLRAELRAVEAIQQALRAGRADDAERQLGDYSRRFPRGELALEAELLRIDLDVARGDRAGARARARALIARPEAARYRERLEELIERD